MPDPSTSTRLHRTDWLDAGLVALGAGGVDGVRIAALCEGLGVTTGSFYHHFDGRPDFLSSLIDYWCKSQVDAVIALVEEDNGSALDRVRRLERFTIELGVGSQDQAMRAWARHNEQARSAVRKADRKTLGLMERLLRELDIPRAEVGVLARVLFFSAIGSYAADHLLRPHRRSEIADTILALVTSRASVSGERRA